jgi:Lysozyme like domain
MSEEIVFVLGIVFAVAVVGYLFIEGPMGTLSASDIATYASNAGFTGSDLIAAVAIALAESGGDPNARGDKTSIYPGGTSYGLWQIHWTVHPEVGDPNNLFDPQTNANSAYKVFQEQGFNAWSTFGDLPGHDNAYAKYIEAATTAINA